MILRILVDENLVECQPVLVQHSRTKPDMSWKRHTEQTDKSTTSPHMKSIDFGLDENSKQNFMRRIQVYDGS